MNVASVDVPSMPYVTPGDPADSHLWHKLSGTRGAVGGAGLRMPSSAPLPRAQLALIEAWITGASRRGSGRWILGEGRMSERGRRIVAGAAVCVALVGQGRTVLAETPSPSLPTSCSRGEVVAYDGGGRFDCVPPHEILRVEGCNSGEFVKAGTGGRLQCVGPSNSSRGVEGLLPNCSQGSTLASEGWGRWKCVEPPG